MNLPEIAFVKPKKWDLGSLAVLALGVILTGANLGVSRGASGIGAVSGGTTTFFVIVQLAVCFLGLLILGKTAKEGTIWGNLFAVGACFVGISGVLLASAIWTLA